MHAMKLSLFSFTKLDSPPTKFDNPKLLNLFPAHGNTNVIDFLYTKKLEEEESRKRKRKTPEENNAPINLSLELSLSSCSDSSEEKDSIPMGKRLKICDLEEEQEEEALGISTRLSLFDDPWKIKKVLETSDVNSLCRLMVSKRLVQKYVIQVWEKSGKLDLIEKLEEKNGNGVEVKVWDCNRKEEFKLTLKHLVSSGCYVLNTHWSCDFVKELGLKRGDKIGLCWCTSYCGFFFSLLARAPVDHRA